jgi:hypothetical protein
VGQEVSFREVEVDHLALGAEQIKVYQVEVEG